MQGESNVQSDPVEVQARNELEAAERLGNEQSALAAKKRLYAIGINVEAERAAEKRSAAAKKDAKDKESAPQGRSSRKDDKA
jgi:hypothetical protein